VHTHFAWIKGRLLLPLNNKENISTKMSAANHLEQIRSQTQYPTYRGVIGVLTILGYIGGAIMAIASVLSLVNKEIVPAIVGVIVSAIVIFVVIPFYKEVSLMLVDAVDSTLEKNSRH